MGRLVLEGNPLWFRDDEAREYLIDFIKRQTVLDYLKLEGNNLRDDYTLRESETAKDLNAWKDEKTIKLYIIWASAASSKPQ